MRAIRAGLAVLAFGLVATVAGAQAPTGFRVDPSWPQALPNRWILGQVAGVFVDSDQHVWIVQRPRSLTDDEKAASFNPPRARCCVPAPPVIEFDQAGKVLRSWGGPGQGYEWPQNEHGVFVDPKGFVWIGGNGDQDGQVLKFTKDGKFVLQIGHAGKQTDSTDTARLGRPANFAFDAAANEIYVADGYYNRRVIVFDADNGAFKRMWGAYGKKPAAQPFPNEPGKPPADFGSPVHCVRIAADGLVYVCDRANNRFQVFRKDGTFVKEVFQEPETKLQGSMWDLVLYPDAAGSMLLTADGANNELRLVDKASGKLLARVGKGGRQPGEFHWVHNIAIDAKGDVFATEVDTGKRIQKFVPVTAGR